MSTGLLRPLAQVLSFANAEWSLLDTTPSPGDDHNGRKAAGQGSAEAGRFLPGSFRGVKLRNRTSTPMPATDMDWLKGDVRKVVL